MATLLHMRPSTAPDPLADRAQLQRDLIDSSAFLFRHSKLIRHVDPVQADAEHDAATSMLSRATRLTHEIESQREGKSKRQLA